MIKKDKSNLDLDKKQKFKKILSDISNLINIKPKKVSFKKMSKKWASCSTKGNITFNTKILEMPLDFKINVIVHELIHLTIPNHGKLFKITYTSLLSVVKDNIKVFN